MQRPHPPIWVGAGSEQSLVAAAERGFNLLLDQVASFELIGRRIATYRQRLAELGRDDLDIAVTRSLHLVDGPRERAAAIADRAAAFADLRRLTNAGGLPANRMAADYSGDIERATEEGAIIGDPAECAERIERLRAVGADHVLLIERRNDPEALATVAREVWPRLAAASEPGGTALPG